MPRPILSNVYVLPDIDASKYRRMLGLIRKRLGDVELNLNTADLGKLRTSLQSLTSQPQESSHRLAVPEGDNHQDEEGTRSLVPVSIDQTLPVLYSEDLAMRTAHYLSIEHFKRAAEEVVHAKQTEDSRLQKVLADLEQTCTPKEESALVLVEYYAQFFPAQEVLAEKPAGVIRSMFEAIIEALQWLLKVFNTGASVVWGVLKDPDAAYLRFRGEMHELRMRHPDYRWLDYVLLLPDLFRLYVRLMFDPDVAWPVKAKVLGALAYLVCPIDFLPEEFLGPIGYTEDVFLMAKAVLDMTNANQVARGKLQEHWCGDPRMLEGIMAVSQQFEDRLPFFRHIYDWFRQAQKDASFVA